MVLFQDVLLGTIWNIIYDKHKLQINSHVYDDSDTIIIQKI